jgi:hypothetical protein
MRGNVPETSPPFWPVAVVLVLLFLFFPCDGPVVKVRRQSRGVACSNNLKQLGLAARMYLHDHGVFPHAGPSDVPRAGRDHIQLLFDGGYIDDPEVVICPASPDIPTTLDEDGRYVLKAIGGPVSNCSYLWARAPLTEGTPEIFVLAACPNAHEEGPVVLYVSGWTKCLPDPTFQKIAGSFTAEE